MKTIFVTSFHTLISRNIISTDVISRLVQGGNIRVVVVVPEYKKNYFVENYSRPGVVFEGADVGPNVRSKLVGLWKRFAEAMPNTQRARVGRKRTFQGKKKSPLIYYFFYLPAGLLGKSRIIAALFRLFDLHFSPVGRFYALFERYRPDLVFSTDVQNEHDVAMMQDAWRKKIPVIAMVRSWDNLSTRLIRFMPEKLIVHNEIIKGELQKMYGVAEEKIFISGIPHYDRYLKGPTFNREEFLRSLELDPAKKTILYTPVCDFRLQQNSVDRHVVEVLSGVDANVIVRFHPAEPVNIGDFAKPANMFFDRPGRVFNPKIYGDRDVTRENDARLVNTLAAVDVAAAGPSTTVIDAALFDKPVVMIDFYPRPVKDDERIYEYGTEHIEPILKSGGARVAKSKEEFLRLIEEYFAHPEKDRAGRRRIVEEQCWKTDGKASERIADYILGIIQSTDDGGNKKSRRVLAMAIVQGRQPEVTLPPYFLWAPDAMVIFLQ